MVWMTSVILFAKDLLLLALPRQRRKICKRKLLSPVTPMLEGEWVSILLQEFSENRNHITVVHDEYGGFAGIVTTEDVFEQIVGGIEDDFDDEGSIKQHADGVYVVKAFTPLDTSTYTLAA